MTRALALALTLVATLTGCNEPETFDQCVVRTVIELGKVDARSERLAREACLPPLPEGFEEIQ